jgi:uncharacterized protein
MPKPKSFLRVFTETGPLVALAVAIALLVGIAGPASAQFFGFPGFGGGPPQRAAPRSNGGGWFGNDFFAPYQQAPQQQQQQQQQPRQDFSRAPPPAKRDTVPERNVLVIGDAMADWLAYGLEDAYAEQPDMGVIRKHKTVSGLIKYQPKGEPSDWAAAARSIIAAEKADAIVVMLGLNDRVSIREPVVEKKDDKKTEKKDDKKDDKNARAKDAKPLDAKPSDTKPSDTKPSDGAAKPDDKPVDTELSPDDAADAPQAASPERSARSANGIYEFRDERWVELYNKKIDELIGVLKSKGVPVLWVGLPAIRGQKGTSDMLFLDALYRESAAKAGITYVDVWDGFVDEAGRFMQKGPDFEGQIRQLRASDGVFFTKPGARKLAHYVEREVTRLLARSTPIALPTEPATPDANAVPGQPARPLAGPIVPLVASSVGTDQLLGGPGSRPAAVDPLAARTLVKGEALAPPAGRADDFAWPRREIGREQAKGETPVASTTPEGAGAGTAPAPTTAAPATPPKPAPQKRLFRPAQTTPPPGSTFGDFFGFGSQPAPGARQQTAPAPPRPPSPIVPRPPADVGRSAEAPFGNFLRW